MLRLTKTNYRISIKGPTIWNDFVENCSNNFFKFKIKSMLLNFDNEISYF